MELNAAYNLMPKPRSTGAPTESSILSRKSSVNPHPVDSLADMEGFRTNVQFNGAGSTTVSSIMELVTYDPNTQGQRLRTVRENGMHQYGESRHK